LTAIQQHLILEEKMAIFSTLRNFQQNSSKVLSNARKNDGIAYLTSRGKPVALLMPVTPDNFDDISAELKRQRFAASFRAAQTDISKSGKSFTKDDVNQLIATARKKRKK